MVAESGALRWLGWKRDAEAEGAVVAGPRRPTAVKRGGEEKRRAQVGAYLRTDETGKRTGNGPGRDESAGWRIGGGFLRQWFTKQILTDSERVEVWLELRLGRRRRGGRKKREKGTTTLGRAKGGSDSKGKGWCRLRNQWECGMNMTIVRGRRDEASKAGPRRRRKDPGK